MGVARQVPCTSPPFRAQRGPSWYLVPTRDRAIGIDVLRAMAKRIHPRKIVEARGLARRDDVPPKVTTDLIVSAARSLR